MISLENKKQRIPFQSNNRMNCWQKVKRFILILYLMSIHYCHKCIENLHSKLKKNYLVILWVFVIFSRVRVQFWKILDLKQNIYFTRPDGTVFLEQWSSLSLWPFGINLSCYINCGNVPWPRTDVQEKNDCIDTIEFYWPWYQCVILMSQHVINIWKNIAIVLTIAKTIDLVDRPAPKDGLDT